MDKNGKVNEPDISIVSRAFGTKPRDAGWNPIAELDGNNEINMIDISKVAKNFGKSARTISEINI